MRKLYIKSNKKGAALLIAMLAGILITAFCTIMLTVLSSEARFRQVTEDRMIEKYLAEAGIEHGLNLYYISVMNNNVPNDALCSSVGTGNLDNLGTYTIQYKSPTSGNIGTFTGTGIYNGKSYVINVGIDTSTGSIISWKDQP